MKELSIEEKAKAYDEALERARKLKENPQNVFNEYSPKEGDTICDYIFPELRESEDERIREQIIYAINKLNVPESEKSKLLAWLEKQGEKKPQRMISAEAKEAMYNMPAYAWSEEDEKIALSIEQVMNCASLLNIVPEKVDKIRTWLKSLKQRITP